MAHQTYLNDPSVITGMEELYYNTIRLGQIHNDLTETEPFIREADMMFFDMGSIRSTDAPGVQEAVPFGFTAEEACQICWYAGLNNNLSTAGFYEYNSELDVRHQTARVMAVMLWYFIEGFSNRQPIDGFESSQFQKFTVTMEEFPQDIVFYKHLGTGKWWLEVPYMTQPDEAFSQHHYVPCSYQDYLQAGNGEVPDRWLNTHTKLI